MENKEKVVILREIPSIASELLEKDYHIDLNRSGKVLARWQLYRRVKGASAIISLLTDKIDEKVILAAGKQLKIVANYAVGYDNFDLSAFKKHGIIATNTPGQLTESVAEHALALMLTVARKVVEGDQFMRAGKYRQWEPMFFLGQPLIGKTIGIIGTGRIGGAFAKMAHNGLRMKVLYSDVIPNKEIERGIGATKVSMVSLLKQSDVVSIHVPLNATTKHLLSASAIKLMKPSAILINTARGPVIDEKALVSALKKKEIFGAGLDVYENEPDLTPGLKGLNNVVITPHIGSATPSARDEMARMAAANVISVLRSGKPINEVR